MSITVTVFESVRSFRTCPTISALKYLNTLQNSSIRGFSKDTGRSTLQFLPLHSNLTAKYDRVPLQDVLWTYATFSNDHYMTRSDHCAQIYQKYATIWPPDGL